MGTPTDDGIKWPNRSGTAEEVIGDIDLSQRYIIVTGANTGIGLETARVLAARGAQVVMACRNLEKAEAAKASILHAHPQAKLEVLRLDLADMRSVEEFAEAYKAKGWPLHVLLLNAGLYAPPELHTKQGYETTFQVNHLAQMYLAELLVDVLKRSAPSRVVAVSSMAHKQCPGWLPAHFLDRGELSKEDPTGMILPMRIYSNTKLFNILFAREFDRRYKEEGIRAFSLHPGVIDTEFGRNSSFIGFFSQTLGRLMKVSIPQGAATQTFLAAAHDIEVYGGEYFDRCRPTATTSAGYNMESAANLWKTSLEMIQDSKQ